MRMPLEKVFDTVKKQVAGLARADAMTEMSRKGANAAKLKAEAKGAATLAGYCATGVTPEDVLVFLFGIGANGKGSFAEAVAHALGDYAKMFPAEVLMESKGERHPTDLAQFMGVRFALTSEPASSATWNDSRIKSLTGDTVSIAMMLCHTPHY